MFSNVIRSKLGGITSKMSNGPKYENFLNLEVWVETVTVFAGSDLLNSSNTR